jgi:hypothetical protein
MFSALFENRPTTTNKPETWNSPIKFAFVQTVVFFETYKENSRGQ